MPITALIMHTPTPTKSACKISKWRKHLQRSAQSNRAYICRSASRMKKRSNGSKWSRRRSQAAASAPTGLAPLEKPVEADPKAIRTYFSIYFCMTGLHGAHVLIGMAVIAWLLWRANRGDFSAEYFTPVDLGGLYWHLVDLIWIYLFPLLYLIG